MYSSALSLTSALDEGVWSSPRPGRFSPEKDPVPIVQEVGWAPGPVWMVAENRDPTGIRSPDRPARNESLCRLSYGSPPLCSVGMYIFNFCNDSCIRMLVWSGL